MPVSTNRPLRYSDSGATIAAAMLSSILLYLIPVLILGGLLLLLLVFGLLSRVSGGKYVRPIANFLMKIPFVGNWLKKTSRSALEKQNPELASAINKLERMGAARDPIRAQKAISSLTAEERRAYLEAAGEQGVETQATNRAMRRQMARQKKR
jgi:hypothetical protein